MVSLCAVIWELVGGPKETLGTVLLWESVKYMGPQLSNLNRQRNCLGNTLKYSDSLGRAKSLLVLRAPKWGSHWGIWIQDFDLPQPRLGGSSKVWSEIHSSVIKKKKETSRCSPEAQGSRLSTSRLGSRVSVWERVCSRFHGVQVWELAS